MPNYIIHIGPHKTGTSYLQVSFNNTREILAQAGVLYPEHSEDSPGHYRLADRIKAQDQTLVADFARFNGSDFQTILFSAEGLSDISDEGVGFLKSLLGRNQATIVFYCRRWSELLLSGWRELVKHREVQNLPEYVASHMANPFISKVVNPARILEPYEKYFGKECLRLVSYSQIMDQKKDILSHFFENFLTQPVNVEPDDAPINASNSLYEAELIRALNALDWALQDGKARMPIYRRFVERQNTLDTTELFAAMKPSLRTIRMNEGTGSLIDSHRKIAETYQRQIVQPAPKGLLFTPRISELGYIGSEYLLRPASLQSLNDIYRALISDYH